MGCGWWGGGGVVGLLIAPPPEGVHSAIRQLNAGRNVKKNPLESGLIRFNPVD